MKDLEDAPLNKLSKFWDQPGFSPLCIEPNEGSSQQTLIKVNHENRIYVAGHRGLAGSAILRALQAKGFQNLITRTREELDLTDAEATRSFFQERPQYVFMAAAKVGGIHANNTFPAEFLRENLLIQTHVLHESWRVGVKKLLFFGQFVHLSKACSSTDSRVGTC